jgi:hypothetical protein
LNRNREKSSDTRGKTAGGIAAKRVKGTSMVRFRSPGGFGYLAVMRKMLDQKLARR